MLIVARILPSRLWTCLHDDLVKYSLLAVYAYCVHLLLVWAVSASRPDLLNTQHSGTSWKKVAPTFIGTNILLWTCKALLDDPVTVLLYVSTLSARMEYACRNLPYGPTASRCTDTLVNT